jgi:hypothetical protein
VNTFSVENRTTRTSRITLARILIFVADPATNPSNHNCRPRCAPNSRFLRAQHRARRFASLRPNRRSRRLSSGSKARSVPTTSSQPVEVRRALPPPVEVRRALPAVPHALLVSRGRFSENAAIPAPYAESQPVRMPDGTIVEARYQGELPSRLSRSEGLLLARSGQLAIRRGSG